MTRETVTAKAARLLASGAVLIVRVDQDLVDATVAGDTGVYAVARTPDAGWTCTCPAPRDRCSHVTAVKLVTTATTERTTT